MTNLIYLIIFAASFVLLYFALNILILPLFYSLQSKYNKWNEKKFAKFASQLEESYIFIEKKRWIFFSLSPFIFAGLGVFLSRHFLGAVVGFFFGLVFPVMMIKFAKQQRIRKFQSQLVDSLTLINSCLKAGLSFVQSLEMLCEEMPAPATQEFGMVLKENKLGVPLEESLERLRTRMPLEEVNLFVSSVLVARESGGELTKVFTRLTVTIRDNIKLKEKITTLTLQGRLQGLIMSVLPIFFTYFIYNNDKHHFDVMFETQVGRILLISAVAAQIVGMILIKKISTMKY